MSTGNTDALREQRKALVRACHDANADLAEARETAFRADIGIRVRRARAAADAAYAACVAFDDAHPAVRAAIAAEKAASAWTPLATRFPTYAPDQRG